MDRPARVIGVVGAGTMGAGIAQLAAQSGARTLLFDAASGAAASAREQIAGLVARGKVPPGVVDRIEPIAELEALAPGELIIEAVPEDLELKASVLDAVAAVAPEAVLATNTSSLSVTRLAAGRPRPELVVGMHFFNPAPLMRLVEIVAGEESSAAALALARATGEAMDRRVIGAADGPGFVVNRCNRPFSLEALELVAHGLSTPEQVDRVARMAGGFRMGPFELMDLVGIDVGLSVSRSFFEQSFGEPRWRPSPLAAAKDAAGHHGRKTGRGWYRYPPGRPADPGPPRAGGGDGRLLVIAGGSPAAHQVALAAVEAGWEVATPDEADGEVPFLIVDTGTGEDHPPLQGAPQLLLCDVAPLAELDPGGTCAGFHVVPPLAELIELTRSPTTSPAAVERAEILVRSLGCVPEWVADGPGLLLGRIVAQLVNEACFALGAGVAGADDIDAGMVLGLNHPRGPLEWGALIGFGTVLTLLRALQDDTGDPRYRPAPRLTAAARLEATE